MQNTVLQYMLLCKENITDKEINDFKGERTRTRAYL